MSARFRAIPPAEALNHKMPEWLLFVVTRSPQGAVDIMTAGWAMSCSAEPLMFAVAIGPSKHTATLIEASGEFNLCWAAEGYHDMVTFCGTRSGREIDKIAELKLATAPATVNTAPLIEGCTLAVECQLREVYPSGDHRLYLGEVVAAHLADSPARTMVNFGGYYAAALPDPPRPPEADPGV